MTKGFALMSDLENKGGVSKTLYAFLPFGKSYGNNF
jgi:hypothetical protein